MTVNPHIQDLLGKTIQSVVYKTGATAPRQQVFLIFDDGTAFEFYGEAFEWAKGCWSRADLESVLAYMGRPAQLVFSRPEQGAAPPALKHAFDAKYGGRGIFLPRESLAGRTAGSAYSNQGTVHYAFNRDQRGEYLSVLEDHPLAYASLLRVNADGTIEALEQEPQWQYRGEVRADFDARCRAFSRLAVSLGLPSQWRNMQV